LCSRQRLFRSRIFRIVPAKIGVEPTALKESEKETKNKIKIKASLKNRTLQQNIHIAFPYEAKRQLVNLMLNKQTFY